jgi:hypothetical protein
MVLITILFWFVLVGLIVIYAPRENMDPLSPEAILTPEA